MIRYGRSLLALVMLIVCGCAVAQVPDDRLRFTVGTDKNEYRMGEAIDIDIVLENVGDSAMMLFRPDSRAKLWHNWRLICRVIRPTGDTVELHPDVSYSMIPTAAAEHFHRMRPGEAVRLTLRLRPDSATALPGGEPWVAHIEIPKETSPAGDDEIRREYGLRGEYYFISGGGEYLVLRDILGDVFNVAGRYRLEWVYHNMIDAYLIDDENSGYMVPAKVPDAWTGELTATLPVDIQE